MTSSTLSSLPLRMSPIRIYSICTRNLLLQPRRIYSSLPLQLIQIECRLMHWKKLIPTCWTSRPRSDCVSLATEKPSQVLISRTIPRRMQRCNLASELSPVRLRSRAIWCLAQANLSKPTAATLAHLTHNSWSITHSKWQTTHRTSLRASTAKFLKQEVHTWITEDKANTYINY